MKLIESPNKWSCLPCSFAMAIGISLNEMIARIGHDGSDVIWPHLPEPLKRRAFHIQECVVASLHLQFSVTELQFNPCLTPDGTSFSDVTTCDIHKFMTVSKGVLLGKGRQHGHAVAWDGAYIYDPSGIVYSAENQDTFLAHSYYMVQKVNNETLPKM